jgi:hypothetical protein
MSWLAPWPWTGEARLKICFRIFEQVLYSPREETSEALFLEFGPTAGYGSSVWAERSAVAVPARNPQFPLPRNMEHRRSHDQIYTLTNVGTGLIFCDMAIMLGPHYHCHLRVCRRQPTS